MSHEHVQAIGLSLLPGVFWLWHVYVRARRGRAVLGWMAVVFAVGACSPLAVLATSDLLGIGSPPPQALGTLIYFVLAVGLVEEFWKMAAVRFTVYFHRGFREPVDGLLYSACAALGFASAENAHYILSFGDPSLILGRALMATFGHVLMSSFWGYALGRQKQPGGRRALGSLAGLGAAALAHGVYDAFLALEYPVAAMVVIGLMWNLFRSRIRESVRLSRWRSLASRRARECSACRTIVRAEARFCTHCGKELTSAQSPFCRTCLAPVDGRTCCSQCGAVFLPAVDPRKRGCPGRWPTSEGSAPA